MNADFQRGVAETQAAAQQQMAQVLGVVARQYGTLLEDGITYELRIDGSLFITMPQNAFVEQTRQEDTQEMIVRITMPKLDS